MKQWTFNDEKGYPQFKITIPMKDYWIAATIGAMGGMIIGLIVGMMIWI